MGDKKIHRINYLSHYVYSGRLAFFDTFFDLYVYDNGSRDIPYGTRQILEMKTSCSYGGNCMRYIKNPLGSEHAGDYKIIGDIYSISLVFRYLRTKNTVFYTEYFQRESDSMIKKIVFYFFSCCFRNKKILVPTLYAKKTFSAISDNVFYLPQLYTGKIKKNNNVHNRPLKILFVGNLTYRAKNIFSFLDTMTERDNGSVEIGICGLTHEPERNKLEIYKTHFGTRFTYHGVVPHDDIGEYYLQYNTFILPSLSDPIGSVILEAMAHGLPIITTYDVGASGYVENGSNGYIYDVHDIHMLKEILNRMCDSGHRKILGDRSYEIVQQRHRLGNKDLLNTYRSDFLSFLNA